ncbi:MAG: hypothetical protein KDB04_00675 [Acidimicrobiales bacterium]|nr:hypothetical protein [Acidimicrobiales bacterium]
MRSAGHGGTWGRGVVATAAMAAAGSAAVLGGELAWVVHRDLPSFEGSDASGRYEPARSTAAAPLVLVALGDSTLTGPGLDDERELWLWQALHAAAPDRPVDVRSFAVGGWRVADVRRRIGAALACQPDVAVVAVGSNDAIHGTARAAFARELDLVVEELTGRIPVVAVANVGDLGNLERVPPPLSSLLRHRARGIRREIEAVVDRHPRAVLLDVAACDAAFAQGGVFVADRFHPNAAGHQLWAACAVPGLVESLGRVGVACGQDGRTWTASSSAPRR